METSPRAAELPAPDERLVVAGCGYEIVGGEVFAVRPADEPRGRCHVKLSALLEVCAAPEYSVAAGMLTRAGEREDFAPGCSIYPTARDPTTGGRFLEEIAFESVATEALAHAGRRAASLIRRGVRRVFAIDVDRGRGLEWSRATDGWESLGADAVIVDPLLAVPLAVHDLVSPGSAKDALARALIARRNEVVMGAIEAACAPRWRQAYAEGYALGRAEAMAEVILATLVARGLSPSQSERARILGTVDQATASMVRRGNGVRLRGRGLRRLIELRRRRTPNSPGSLQTNASAWALTPALSRRAGAGRRRQVRRCEAGR